MATKENYVILADFVNTIDCDKYRKNLYRHGIIHSQQVNCQNCKDHNHKMKVQYMKCSSQECVRDGAGCSKRYKLQTCLDSKEFKGKVTLLESGTHNSSINPETHYGYKKN